jgi:hypothetical protein
MRRKQVSKVVFGHVEGKVSDIQFCAHNNFVL